MYKRKPRSDDLGVYIDYELAAIQESFDVLAAPQVLTLKPRYKALDKPRLGNIIFADGVNYDPGSGKGLYIYDNGWNLIVSL